MKAAIRKDARELTKLCDELGSVTDKLHHAQFLFNFALEDELVYSTIYEINMLNSRYSYLLRRIKELRAEAEAS